MYPAFPTICIQLDSMAPDSKHATQSLSILKLLPTVGAVVRGCHYQCRSSQAEWGRRGGAT